MGNENFSIDNIDIDKLQNAIMDIQTEAESSDTKTENQEQVDTSAVTKVPETESNTNEIPAETPVEQTEDDYNIPTDEELGYKKFVVKIDLAHVNFFEKLSSDQKNEFVNNQIDNYMKQKKKEKFSETFTKLVKHVFVSTLTIIVTIPLVYIITNKAIQSTLNSYKETQMNFEKLYNNKGGIKKKDLTKLRKLE